VFQQQSADQGADGASGGVARDPDFDGGSAQLVWLDARGSEIGLT
jgi:hypothetical protein